MSDKFSKASGMPEIKRSTPSEQVSHPTYPEPGARSLGKLISPYSHSPWPVWSLSALFLGTSPVGFSNPTLPPFALRFGFGLIFAGAGYVVSSGDVENGSAITTSWSGSYFVVNALRKEMRKLRGGPMPRLHLRQRHPLGLALNGATFVTMILYGAEYFWFQNFRQTPK